jgi:ATP-dependent protease ClpP protease subunit
MSPEDAKEYGLIDTVLSPGHKPDNPMEGENGQKA